MMIIVRQILRLIGTIMKMIVKNMRQAPYECHTLYSFI